MMIYLFIILLLFGLIYYYDYLGNKKFRKECFVSCGVILALLAGLRYRLGIDTVAYEDYYPLLPNLLEIDSFNFDSTRYGVGFVLFVAVIKTISPEFVIFQLIHSAIVTTVVFRFLYTNSKHIFFAVLLYLLILYFPLTYEVLRESLGVCMMLIGWKYFLKSEWVKYYICAGIGILFHPSAALMLFLPILFIPVFRPFFRIGKTFLITVPILFLTAQILSIKFMDLLTLVEISTVENYSSAYANSKYLEGDPLSIKGIIASCVKILVYPILAFTIIKLSPHRRNNSCRRCACINIDSKKYMDKIQYMFCWSIYISIITLFIPIFYRFNNYLFPFTILVYSDAVFERFKICNYRIKLSFGIWIIALLPYVSLLSKPFFSEDGESGLNIVRRYVPYESVLTMKKDDMREKLYSFYDR